MSTQGVARLGEFQVPLGQESNSVFTYNLDGDAEKGKGTRGHVVNMVAMPSDLPLDDTFVGRLGSNQYQFRDNPDPLSPLPTGLEDAVGVLQWRASRFRAGETFRINMYYDTFRSFAR